MESKINDPSFNSVHDAWIEECKKLGLVPESKTWSEFIDKCGLYHLSMYRLRIEDHAQYMLAKIKYGI
jgi:hypothetical protein